MLNLLFFASATALYQPLGAHLRHHRAAVVAMDTADTAKQAKLYAIMAQLAKEDAEKAAAKLAAAPEEEAAEAMRLLERSMAAAETAQAEARGWRRWW